MNRREPRQHHLNIHFLQPEIMAGVYANFPNMQPAPTAIVAGTFAHMGPRGRRRGGAGRGHHAREPLPA